MYNYSLVAGAVAHAAASLVWLYFLRRVARRAYRRGHDAGAFDSFPQHYEQGRRAGHADGFISGYTFGSGKPASAALVELAHLRAS